MGGGGGGGGCGGVGGWGGLTFNIRHDNSIRDKTK